MGGYLTAPLRFRDELPADRSAIAALLAEAFGGPAEAGLVAALRADGDLVVSVVAEQASAIVGHAAISPLSGPAGCVAFAPVAVDPAYQRRGIGTALVAAVLDRAREGGAAMVFVLGEPAFYGRFGFSTEAAAGFMCPYTGPHFMALRLDGETTPAALEYAPAFGALS